MGAPVRLRQDNVRSQQKVEKKVLISRIGGPGALIGALLVAES